MKAKKPTPLYSQRSLEQFGRSLTRDELRLVQGYRGLPAVKQAALDTALRAILVDRTQEANFTVSYAAAVPDYRWKCDEPPPTGGV
jgi:hypothetical protein